MTTRLPKLVTVCTTCNATIVFLEGQEVKKCRYCRNVNQRPQTEKEIGGFFEQLENADDYFNAGDYDSAEELYDYVIRLHPDEHRAYWGKLLCKYGVQYVGDGAMKTILCHFIRDKSFISELDYKKACKFADDDTRSHYEAEGERINAVQMEIRRQSENEKPFDIFLCYKETDPDSGERTRDSERMSALYDNLTEMGYRVFYAHKTLYGADISAEKYEAIIYHAIHTARLMIVFASKAFYLNTFWVKSEWTRYQERYNQLNDKGTKRIVPLCEGITPEELPVELGAYQAWQWDSLLSLLNNIRMWVPIKDAEEERRKQENERQYKLANEYMSKNKYTAAAEIFDSLGDYSNSSLLKQMCQQLAGKEVEEQQKKDEEERRRKDEEERRRKDEEEQRRKDEEERRRKDEEERRQKDEQRRKEIEQQEFASFFNRVKNATPIERKTVTDISIPDGITTIENGLFQGFLSLKEVQIPQSVTAIGSEAFKNCTSLRALSIPDTVQKIGTSAFENCGLMKVRIPDSTSSIGEGAFYHCHYLREVSLPEHVQQMGDGVFHDCIGLTTVSFPSGVNRLGTDMFSGCRALKTITIPDSVIEIGDRAFFGCKMLSTVVLPASIKRIGMQVFNSCQSLHEIIYLGDRKSWEEIEGIKKAGIPSSVSINYQPRSASNKGGFGIGKLFRKR